MKEDLAQLIELAAIDSDIDLFLEKRENFPGQIADLERQLNEISSSLTAKKQEIGNLEAEKGRLESDLAEQRDWILKREETVKQIKTNKEYHASLKEISQARKTVQTLEETLLEVMTRLDENKPKLGELETSISTQTETIHTEIETFRGQLSSLDGDIEKRIASRSEQEGKMKPILVRRYRTIKTRVAPAMAKAAGGACLECNTRIPPQLYIDLQKFSALINCPRCYRILYLEG